LIGTITTLRCLTINRFLTFTLSAKATLYEGV
jgi:hypothetical protein